MRTRSDASDTFSTTSGTSRPHILWDFTDTEVPSEGDEWFPDLANLVVEDSTARPDPSRYRNRQRPLCPIPECGQPQTSGDYCYDHYLESLPEWDKHRIRWVKANHLLSSAGEEKDEDEPGRSTAARPKLHKASSSPGKPKKLPKQVALYFASAGEPGETLKDFSGDPATSFEHVSGNSESATFEHVVRVGRDKNLDKSYESKDTVDTFTHTTCSNVAVVQNWDYSTDENRDSIEVIDELTDAALTSPWPGRNGPMDARILSACLCQARRMNSLTIRTGLRELAYEAGLTEFKPVKFALERLAEKGWLGFELGDPDVYGPDGEIRESGRPSRITLNLRVTPSTGSINPMRLPTLTLDIFREHDQQLGSAGWFAMTRIFMETRDESDRPWPLLGVVDIVRLTGMDRRRVERLMKRMIEAKVISYKEGHKYHFMVKDPDANSSYYNPDNYAVNKLYARKEWIEFDRKKRREKAEKAKELSVKPPARFLSIPAPMVSAQTA
jgi:hypothetical protein